MNEKFESSADLHQQSVPLYRLRHDFNRNTAMPITELIKSLRLYMKYFILWIIGWALIATMYLHYARPQFNASAMIILNPARQIASANSPSEVSIPNLDGAQTESQIQVLKSERLLNAVFDALAILNSPEYSSQENPSSRSIVDFFGSKNSKKAEINPELRRRLIFQAFTNRVSVKRIGQSYVLEVSYQSFIPQESARVANAISLQYIKSQIALKAASVQRGTEYLQGRIVSINNQLKSASEGVASGVIPDMQFPDADAQIISAAIEPLGKTSPKASLILAISITFSFASGLALILLRNALDKTLKVPAQITQGLQVFCFGVLPRFKMSRGSKNSNYRLIRSRQFHNLKTEIYINSISIERRIIGVFSWSGSAGCTFVASNLARTISSNNRRALLVNFDFSSSSDGSTKSENIKSGADVQSPFSKQSAGRIDGIDTLSVSEFSVLNSLKRKSLVKGDELDKRWAHSGQMDIVIDFPSIEQNPECLTVCDTVDCAVLVIEFGQTSVEHAEKAIHSLRNSGVKTIGVVINKAV